MAQGEYIGKRVTATIPTEIFDKLIVDSKQNGMRPSTRAAQILSLFYNGQLTLNGAPVYLEVIKEPVDNFEKKQDKELDQQSVNGETKKEDVPDEQDEIKALNTSGIKARKLGR